MKNKLYIIAIVLLIGNTIYSFIEHQKYIDGLEQKLIERDVAMETVNYGFRYATGSMGMFNKLLDNHQLTIQDSTYLYDNVLVYADSAIKKINEIR